MDCAEHHRPAIKEEERREEQASKEENRLLRGKQGVETIF